MKKILSIITILLFAGVVSAQTAYTLDELKKLATDSSAEMLTARNNIEAARQQKKEAFTNYFPQVSATAFAFKSSDDMVKMDINTSDVLSPELAAGLSTVLPPQMLQSIPENISVGALDGGAIASISAVQPVFAGGQIVNGNRLADIGVTASELQLQLSKNQTEMSVEQYYWQLVSLKEKLKTIDAVSELLKRLESDVAAAEKAGVAIKNDLLQVKIKINEINKSRIQIENGLDLTRRLLANKVGKSADGFDVAEPTDSLPDFSMSIDHNQAVENTTEYRLLDANVNAAELQKKMSVGKNLPTVAVGAGYTAMRLMETNNNFGMIFATANVPISGWWGGSHATKRQEIALDNARTQRDNTRELLIINMDNCLNAVNDARRQLDIATETVSQSEENLRLNQDYYRVGTSTMSDLLQAEQQHRQALDALTDAKIEYQMALVKYRQAVGN